MQKLFLKHANKSRLGVIDWGPNDFDVLDTDRCVGRIFMSPASPPDRNRMWTMKDFKTPWLAP